MASPATESLHTRVLPSLDLAEKGYFARLNPVRSGRVHEMDCPSCHTTRKAYYFPGGPVVACRKTTCEANEGIKVFEFLLSETGKDYADLGNELHELAGIEVPGRSSPESAEASRARQLDEVFWKLAREALLNNSHAMEFLSKPFEEGGRGYPKGLIAKMPIGFYPGKDYFFKGLRKAGCDLKMAASWNLFGRNRDEEAEFAGRVIGAWPQPDGSFRLWSRSLGDPTDGRKKYDFSVGLKKDIPFNFKEVYGKSLVVVEGTFDALALTHAGFTAAGLGGAHPSRGQIATFVERGVRSLIQVTDGDEAGHAGALKFVGACEAAGIDTAVAVIPDGGDDPDSLLAKGKRSEVVDLINYSITGGEYLAYRILAARYGSTPKDIEGVRAMLRTRGLLGEVSAIGFDRTMAQLGIHLPTIGDTAGDYAASLRSFGLPEDEVARRTKNKFQVELNEASNG